MLPAHTNILQVTPDPPGGLTARVVAIHHDRDTATGEQLRPLALPGVIGLSVVTARFCPVYVRRG